MEKITQQHFARNPWNGAARWRILPDAVNEWLYYAKIFDKNRAGCTPFPETVRPVPRSYIMITDGAFFGHLNLGEGCDTI